MKFSITESVILLAILKNAFNNETDKNKQEALDLLTQKIEQQEYIKGRLLKSLYTEVVKHMNDLEVTDVTLETLANRIKFKATPR